MCFIVENLNPWPETRVFKVVRGDRQPGVRHPDRMVWSWLNAVDYVLPVYADGERVEAVPPPRNPAYIGSKTGPGLYVARTLGHAEDGIRMLAEEVGFGGHAAGLHYVRRFGLHVIECAVWPEHFIASARADIFGRPDRLSGEVAIYSELRVIERVY